jgi:hypothetical protein
VIQRARTGSASAAGISAPTRTVSWLSTLAVPGVVAAGVVLAGVARYPKHWPSPR